MANSHWLERKGHTGFIGIFLTWSVEYGTQFPPTIMSEKLKLAERSNIHHHWRTFCIPAYYMPVGFLVIRYKLTICQNNRLLFVGVTASDMPQ